MEKRSFFERLTGSAPVDRANGVSGSLSERANHALPLDDSAPLDEEGQLSIDMWQNANEVIVQTMVGGIKPEDLDVSISHDTVTIRGKRLRNQQVSNVDFLFQELFWGMFSRSIMLPQEVDADSAEASIKHGLLTIRLPKLNKGKIQKLRVKND
jgi:HSP20 family protein